MSLHSKTSKIAIISTVVITIIVLIGLTIMLLSGTKDTLVIVEDNYIKIQTMFGVNVNLAEVSNITLIEKTMEDIGIGHRNNGFGGVGHAQKGHFSSEGRKYMLFVQSRSTPTIWIERPGKEDIYISLSDSGKTRALYSELLAELAV
jgi:hypothetical protein